MGLYVGIALVVWILTMGAWWVLAGAFRSADVDKMKSRLLGTTQKTAKKKEGSTQETALFSSEEPSKGKIALQLLQKYKLKERLSTLLEQAGLKWNPGRFVHGCMACFIVGYLVAYLILPSSFRPVALLIAVGAGLAPISYVVRLRAQRLKKFEAIFPDALEFISRSMRAGHAFSVSLEMIHREFSEPLASEFRRTFEEHNLGLPLDVALQSFQKRVPSLDVHFFVSAVLLQKRTGGNLAEILDKLAYIIRERFKLRGRIRAVSAHGRMTAIALSCIPLGVAVLMFYTNPDYVKFFFLDDTGNIMLGVAVFLQLSGYLIMKKIVSIEV